MEIKTDYNALLKEELTNKGYIILKKNEIKDALTVCTKAFEDYEFYLHIKPKFNEKHWIGFKTSVYKAMYKETVIFTDPTRSCCCAICGNGYEKTKATSYIANGILKSVFTLGIKAIARFARFDDFICDLRKKHTNLNCIYCFDISVKKSEQGKGIAKKINKTLQEFSDKYKRDLFFETLSAKNAEIYKNHGFELVEEIKLTDNDKITVYCFMYKHKN